MGIALIQCNGVPLTAPVCQTRSGRDFSTPYQAITPTAPGYSYGGLLSGAIKRSVEDDCSEYEDNESEDCEGGASDSEYVESPSSSDGEGGALENGSSDSDDNRMHISDSEGASTAPPPAAHSHPYTSKPPRPRPAYIPEPALAIVPVLTIGPTPPAASTAVPTSAIPPKKKRRSVRAIQEQRAR